MSVPLSTPIDRQRAFQKAIWLYWVVLTTYEKLEYTIKHLTAYCLNSGYDLTYSRELSTLTKDSLLIWSVGNDEFLFARPRLWTTGAANDIRKFTFGLTTDQVKIVDAVTPGVANDHRHVRNEHEKSKLDPVLRKIREII